MSIMEESSRFVVPAHLWARAQHSSDPPGALNAGATRGARARGQPATERRVVGQFESVRRVEYDGLWQ